MNKVYCKDGNSKTKSKMYCKDHFLKRHGREPNITDTAHLGLCSDCHPQHPDREVQQ